LFEKKDHEKWLANLLEKGEIDDKQHEFIQDLLEKREQSESDRTSEWWKNLFEEKFNGAKPFWAKETTEKVEEESEEQPSMFI